MVGRSAKLAKQSPPPSLHNLPPYDHPSVLAETTTTRTEVVTTTTTTHFFSFPLWKKRGPVSNSSSRRSTSDAQPGADEHGILLSSARSSFYMVEKDLPPIPADEPALSAGQRPGPSISVDSVSRSEAMRSMSPTARPPDSARSIPSQQSTSALAQASLEVGLSPILPRTSSSSSFSEINTVVFAPSPSPSPLRLLGTRPRLHKSKSAQKLGTTMTLDTVPYNEQRRRRGISFNGSTLFTIGKSDAKVRDQERKDYLDHPSTLSSFHSTSKGLARKTSFWSRRKMQSQDAQADPPSMEQTQSTQLPVLPPISPFSMDITVPSPSNPTFVEQRRTHTRGLSRSHSAHSSIRPTPSEIKPGPSIPRRALLARAPSPSPASVPLTPQSAGSVRDPIVGEENAPKRRPRAQTNPPLLNRLSLGWFPSSSPSLPPPRLSNHSHVFVRPHTSSSALVSSSKGRQMTLSPSTESPSSRHLSRLSVEKGASMAMPFPTGYEEPSQYLKRLRATVGRAEIAGILASSPDPFYIQTLQTYIAEFDFVDDPLDIALRKLLMDVGLPRETQQIDRVIESFAKRYLQCNSSLFSSDDHPYILAFSLIMLHTDAFNKSNKRKMSKADYIKNTQLPGVFTEVLTCFYDNIVFAPFILIEDPLDFNGQRGIAHEGSSQSIATPPTPILKATKIDPYYLIANNLLGSLRIDVDSLIPRENPYSYEGTAGPWDEVQLQRSFLMANQVEVSVVADPGRASPFFSKATINGLAGPSGNNGIAAPAAAPISAGEIWSLRLTKVGLLNRKDDVLEGGKKATNRKWKPWSVILTGSQLLFFRDLSWANSLLSISPERQKLHPQSGFLRPDELLSVRGAIAIYDKSYTRHDNTFRFLLPDSRQLLLQASTEKELNEWIARINYAGAFKTAGVRMRPLEMSKTDVQLTGVAAATSHLHDLQTRPIKSHIWNDGTPRDLMRMVSNDTESVESRPVSKRLAVVRNTEDMDLEVPTAPEIDGAEQFKATFDQVKADLAAGLMLSNDRQMSPVDASSDLFPSPAVSPCGDTSHPPSRTTIIQSKIDDLDSRITAVQAQLETKLRFARNIATLTPFQKSTRDRLLVAVQDVAHRVVQARLEITRLICHRNVLANDVASEWRSWHRAKTIALQAATETLQNRHESVPRMTLSQPASNPIDIRLTSEDSIFSRPSDSSPSRKSESSIGESFHSAMDFGPDWPSPEDVSSKFLGTSHLFDSPPLSSSSSVHSHTTYGGSLEPSGHSSTLPLSSSSQAESPRSSIDLLSHEKVYTAPEIPEKAEDWNQTRCARRVSLVRLPSDLQLKPRFVHHNQQAIKPRS